MKISLWDYFDNKYVNSSILFADRKVYSLSTTFIAFQLCGYAYVWRM